MKKVLLILILLMSFTFFACLGDEPIVIEPSEPEATDPTTDPETNPVDIEPTDEPKETDPKEDDPTDPTDDQELKKVSQIDVTFNSATLKGEATYEKTNVSITQGERKYNIEKGQDEVIYTVNVVLGSKEDLSDDLVVTCCDETNLTTFIDEEIIDNEYIAHFSKVFDVTRKIEIKLNTSKYTVESLTEGVEAEIVKPLDYLVIVTKVYFNKEISVDFEFISNNKVVSSDKYTIEEYNGGYVLTYKIDDPNWTPFY